MTRAYATICFWGLGGLAFAVCACDEPVVTADPKPPASTAPATAAAPSVSESFGSATHGASSSPAVVNVPKKPASNLTNDEVCRGAPREGCIPRNDPFGFVARE